MVLGLLVNVTPSNFFSVESLGVKLWFTNHIFFRTAVLRKLFEISFSYNAVISNAFACSSRWRRKPWQGLFSQPLECLYQELCKHRKKIFYCFYKITFPRKKAKLSCLEQLLKDKFLPVAKSCTRSLYTVRVISPCFARKDAFQNAGFSHLKFQLKRKKNWQSMFLLIIQVSAEEEMGK